jgi:aminoglycoside phosphotransferase (APT) family kinase protein
MLRQASDACEKEVAILDLVRKTVPVPEVIHVETGGVEGSLPFVVLSFVQALTFQQLKQSGNLSAIHQAASSVGETLAAIGAYEFSKPGRLVPATGHQLQVGAPYTISANPIPEILDSFLDSAEARRRLGPPLVERLRNLVWTWAPALPEFTNVSQLVHSDFGNRNILVNEVNGAWKVVAVLDWEFAFSGSPLIDVANFLRYDTTHDALREPHFSRSFVEHGGKLPHGWRQIIRILDLTALVECLSHDYLSEEFVAEIVGLINSTLDECQIEA